MKLFYLWFLHGEQKLCIIYLYLIIVLSVILNVITMYIRFILDVELS